MGLAYSKSVSLAFMILAMHGAVASSELHWMGGIVVPLKVENQSGKLQLYYANISVGEPPQLVTVACDTGSNLLWVNCNCSPPQGVVPGKSAEDGCSPVGRRFSPNASTSATHLACSSAECVAQAATATTCDSALVEKVCASIPFPPSFCQEGEIEHTCPYLLSYSDGSHSAGTLITDMLRIPGWPDLQTRVPFGCGQSQGGHLRDPRALGSASGVWGIGRGAPTLRQLAQTAHVPESLSICLGGVAGGSSLILGPPSHPPKYTAATPFGPLLQESALVTMSLASLKVDGVNVQPQGSNTTLAAVDSGAAFTVLPVPIFNAFVEAFVRAMPRSLPRTYSADLGLPGPDLPPCWDLTSSLASTSQLAAAVPDVSLVFEGGAELSVPRSYLLRPVLSVGKDKLFACLSAVSGGPVHMSALVLGEDWLRNLFLTFEHDAQLLRWARVNCSNGNATLKEDFGPFLLPDFNGPDIWSTLTDRALPTTSALFMLLALVGVGIYSHPRVLGRRLSLPL